MTAGSPNTIGPYTITREVGRGDMGVVYLVTEAPDLGPHGIKYPIRAIFMYE